MIGQMAIAIALLGFNDLERSVTLLFFSETDFIFNYYLHVVHATWNPTILLWQRGRNYMVTKCELVL